MWMRSIFTEMCTIDRCILLAVSLYLVSFDQLWTIVDVGQYAVVDLYNI